MFKKEYELKILNVDRDKLSSCLTLLGGIKISEKVLLRRIVFGNETVNLDSGWLRLRAEENKTTLTLKRMAKALSVDRIEEIEIEVSEFEGTKSILLLLGLKMINYQENYRERWILGDVICDFCDWPDLPTFLEIEGPSVSSVEIAAVRLGFDSMQFNYNTLSEIYKNSYGEDILNRPSLVFAK